MAKNQEQEFKWEAAGRGSFVKFVDILKKTAQRVSGPQDVRITDVYLDNVRRTLSRQKMAFRIRCINGCYEVTLKTRSQLRRGLAVRREWTLPLAQARTRKQVLQLLARLEKWKGVVLTDLRPYFVIKNKRTIYQVQDAECLCEAALDEYVTLAAGHQFKRREIELELKKGCLRNFKKLIQKLTAQTGFSAVKISKVAGAEKWIEQNFRFN